MGLLGELVFTSSDAVYTPPVSRQSNTCAFAVEVTQISGTSPSLAIDIEHKNLVDSSWSTAASFTALTAAGAGAKVATGLKEQVRLKLTMSGTNGWARAFVYSPQWQ
ncbi:MAG: hypothetical protein HY292_26560 [Planctomycetes bacterium]|nr:hypothetical protein [Planctomycetota bacterium]